MRYLRRRRGKKERRLERPRTAVLKHPAVLDEALKDKVDMTMTKKRFLAAVKLCTSGIGGAGGGGGGKKTPPGAPPSLLARARMRPPGAPVGYRRGSGPGLGESVFSPPVEAVVKRSPPKVRRERNLSRVFNYAECGEWILNMHAFGSPKKFPRRNIATASANIIG